MPPKKELAIFIVLTGFAVIGVTTVFSTTGFFDIIGVSGAYAQNDTVTPTTELSNTTHDIFIALVNDAEFLHDAADSYITNAIKADKPDLVETWQTIKNDTQTHVDMLKRALERDLRSNLSEIL
ncbi:MAG TPA: hypothetical protein VE130_16820 [Nitrososphaeraceae archaeon]|jgi:rubrerythrin|nr:hypothetical protein [Nitrososphaeraceae archaeon]